MAIAVGCAAARAAPASLAVVEQPRAFGHFVGDHVEQRVLLELSGGGVEPTSLPRAERLGAWLERVSARVESDPAGRRWLVAEYLIVNSARALAVARIPEWTLDGASATDGGAVRLTVPSWPLDVVPLAPVDSVSAGAVRSDREPPTIPLEPLRQRLRWSLAALAAVVLSWLAWLAWRDRRTARHGPFAQACRQLRELAPGDPAAWYLVHRAFERSAAGAVRRSSLPLMFGAVPALLPMRAEIEEFFARSEARFFAPEGQSDGFDLGSFCRRLRRLEKRGER